MPLFPFLERSLCDYAIYVIITQPLRCFVCMPRNGDFTIYKIAVGFNYTPFSPHRSVNTEFYSYTSNTQSAKCQRGIYIAVLHTHASFMYITAYKFHEQQHYVRQFHTTAHLQQQHTRQFHARQFHARQFHARQLHARQFHARQLHAQRLHKRQKSSRKLGSFLYKLFKLIWLLSF